MAASKVTKPMAKHGFAIQEDELLAFKQLADDLDKTPSALTRELILAFNAGHIKLPKNEALQRSYEQ